MSYSNYFLCRRLFGFLFVIEILKIISFTNLYSSYSFFLSVLHFFDMVLNQQQVLLNNMLLTH